MAINKSIRFRILARDNFTCRYCGAKAPDVALQVDHIMPRSQGGADLWDNLITACFDCNQGKKDFVLSDEQMVQLRPTAPPMPLRRRQQAPAMPVQVRLPEPEPEPVAVVLPAPPRPLFDIPSGLTVLVDCEGCGRAVREDEYDKNDGYCQGCNYRASHNWCAICDSILDDDWNDIFCPHCAAEEARKERRERRSVSAWRTDGWWADRIIKHDYRRKVVAQRA